MRSEVGEWLATCIGSPICILLLSWSLLIYQSQPSSSKRRVDVFTVAILAQSLVHQLGLLLFAILTLVRPANHFGEFCSSLVWILNSSSILQELSLTSIAIFAALTVRDDGPNVKKHHIKYHLASLSVIGACIGVTGVLNFEPEGCVFLAQDISPKYGLYFNGLRSVLAVTTLLGLLTALFRYTCRPSPKAELLKSVSDLSEASSKNSSSSGPYECQHHLHSHHSHHSQHQQQQQQQQHLSGSGVRSESWEQPSSGAASCTSGSTNSRACLKQRRVHVVDEASGWTTVYTLLFVCYGFDRLPMLIVSIRPDILRNLCTPLNLATWLPLVKDTLLPIFLAIFDKMFCQYVAKVYTKQDHSTRLSHGGLDGKFRHFEQDGEFKLQLNLNHGLKFPLGEAVNGAAGSLYGRLHNHPGRGRSGTMLLGVQQYGRSSENAYASVGPESSSYTSSSHPLQQESCKSPKLQPRQLQQQQQQQQRTSNSRVSLGRANSASNGKCQGGYGEQLLHELGRRRPGSGELFTGQKLDGLVQLDDQQYQQYGAARRLKHFAKSLDEIREEAPRRNARSVLGSHPESSETMSGFRSGPFVVHLGQDHQQQQQQQHQQQQHQHYLQQSRSGRQGAAAAALRRNQSFDIHPRYPRIELPFVSSRTYDVKRELAIKRSLQAFEQNRRNEEEYGEEEDEENDGYETSDDESCDRESQDFDTMSSCRSRARSCCSVTTVANDDFEFFQRKGAKELTSLLSRPIESKGSMRCFTPRIIEANQFEAPISPNLKPPHHHNLHNNIMNNNNNNNNNSNSKNFEIGNNGNSKPVIQSYQLKKKMSPGYSLNDLDRFGGSTVASCSHGKPPPPALSIESLKSILRSSDVSYLDNGEICRHDIGGSAPDFKKIFVTEFI